MTIQYISQEKFDALKEEAKDIKLNKMPETANRIDEAKQMGDLKENAEYHAAREQMGWLAGRLTEIEAILDHAEIVSKQGPTDAVGIGSDVTVSFNGKEKTYTVVGAQEANPLEGKISNESPIGSALFGKKKGAVVDVSLPAGVVSYTILSIA